MTGTSSAATALLAQLCWRWRRLVVVGNCLVGVHAFLARRCVSAIRRWLAIGLAFSSLSSTRSLSSPLFALDAGKERFNQLIIVNCERCVLSNDGHTHVLVCQINFIWQSISERPEAVFDKFIQLAFGQRVQKLFQVGFRGL